MPCEVKQDRMMRWYVSTSYGRIYYPNQTEAIAAVNRVAVIMAGYAKTVTDSAK